MAQTPATFRQTGNMIDHTPVSAKTAGDVVVQEKLVGICKSDIAADSKGAICVSGVFNVPKDTSNITAVGTPLYWDENGSPYGGTALSGCATTTATGNTFMGWALELAGATTGMVKILLRSANDADTMATDDLSDVGTVDHTAGDILIADGTKFECLPISGAFNLAATGLLSMNCATVAADGSSQTDAAAIADGFTLVSAADGTKGVKLPTATAGDVCVVKNNAAAILKVYPFSGDTIDELSANAAIMVPPYGTVTLHCYSTAAWYASGNMSPIAVGAYAASYATGSGMAFSATNTSAARFYAESTADLTSAYNCRTLVARHLIVTSSGTVAHETYGAQGQVCVKNTTLTHIHGGLLGTFEVNTAATVNGAYAYSVAGVISRLGVGTAALTATKPICGFSAIYNGGALVSGASIAFAACSTTDTNFTYLLAADHCDNLFFAATGTAYECGVKIASITELGAAASGVVRCKVGSTYYYMPLYAAGELTGE